MQEDQHSLIWRPKESLFGENEAKKQPDKVED